MRPSLLRIVGVAVVFLVTGCATVPRASEPLVQQSRTFVPPPGKASVYVIRPYNYIGSCCLWNVTLDFQEFGSLGLRSYLYGVVEPGDHFVGTLTQGISPSRVKFTAVSGHNYFFTISPGFASLAIDALDEEDGRSRVLAFTPSGDNRFELLGSQPPSR